MIDEFVEWMRLQGRWQQHQRRWSRWLGRSWAHLTYATKVEPTWLEVNHLDITIRDLPPAFEGLRLVQLSDLHYGHQLPFDHLLEAVDVAQAQRPDVIVLTGDFIHAGFKHVRHVAGVLGRLHAPFGVFAVLGNHDFSVRNSLGIRRHKDLHRAVADALSDRGIRVLNNENVPLIRHGQHVVLAGVNDLWSRACDVDRALAGLCESLPRIVLAHNPRTIDQLGGRRCDLMLSGHTHGGQVDLPVLGRVVLGRNAYAAGLYSIEDSLLYVNKGVGFGFRIRYRVRPEVTVLTLQRTQLIVA